MPLTDDLLARLACPKCKGRLKPAPEGEAFDCEQCKLRYPVEDDVLVLLVAEAKPID